METFAFWPHARANPEALALVGPDGIEISAGELLARCNRIARGLQAMGCRRGDVVATVLGNEIATLEVALATFQIGLYLVPVNRHLVSAEIGYIIENSGARAVICSPAYAETVTRAADAAGLESDRRLCTSSKEGFRALSEIEDGQSDADPEERAAGGTMNYTSGTTGMPKGVRRPLPPIPPEGLASAYAGFLMLFGIRPGGSGVHLVVSPLYHTAVLYWSLNSLHLGHTVVLMDKWTGAGMLERIDWYRVTHTHMVPTQFVRLLTLSEEERSGYDVSSMTHAVHGAAPCPPSVKREMLEWWGEVVYEYYAATEGGGTVVTPAEWLERPGTVGRPWQGAEIRVLDDAGVDCAPDEVGTVYIRMAQGGFEYHEDKKKTDEATRTDGFFTVGDAGYLDAEGYLFLCDRKADMIISGGVNIYPAEIEAVLITHSDVVDVAVFGVPDTDWGEQVKAIVELREGLEPSEKRIDELLAYGRERLAKYKCPKSIEVIEVMPRDPNGKLAKRKLRDPYWADTGRAI